MFWGLWPCLLFLDGSLRYESSTLILCKELGSSIFHLWVSQSVSQICFTPLFFFSINSTYMKRILHFENVTPKSSYNGLKIRGFFQSGEGTWLEFLWGGGTKLELRYWVRIVIINQIPPGGGTANLKSRNLSRKKVSCTTILQSTWRGHVLLAPSGALIAIPTYYWSTTPPHPLFQITPVLNTWLSLSEPLQLCKGYNAI
jgi:hypothetical protein